MIEELTENNKTISSYQPGEDVIRLTKHFKDEFGEGHKVLHSEQEELNGYSVIERMNKDQRTFNSFVDESVEDPHGAWKWRGTRGIARNRALAMHAHLTSTLSIPMAFAQNEKQEEDKDMSNIMRDILEWMGTNSEYRQSYILATMGTLVNPVTYLGAEWVETFQKVKEKTDDGWIEKEVLDEELSGFRAPVYSADQVLIQNPYEQNIQRQRFPIKRVYKDYKDLEAKWGWHPNWDFVQPRIKTIYSDEDGLFYDIKDDEHNGLAEEATGWSRKTDTEITFINGIYFGTPNVDFNPIKHRDNLNRPKVPLTPFGYERINEHYFYFKSLMNRVGWDSALIDAMYENTMNRETIDLYTPMAISGAENLDTQIIFPGSVVAFESENAKARPMIPQNRVSGYQALREIENSISEASVSETQAGKLPDAAQKAFSVARAEQNARTILKGVFRNIGESVAQYGQLMVDIALQHLTAPQYDEITGAIHYRPFFLEGQKLNGRTVPKRILFSEALMGKEMTDEEADREALKLLKEFPAKEQIYLVNPHLFSKMKYFVRIEPEAMIEKNEAQEQLIARNMYAILRGEPLIDPEKLVRKLLDAHYHGEAEEFVARRPQARPEVQRILGQRPQEKEAEENIGRELSNVL